jgi:hypothetical protein
MDSAEKRPPAMEAFIAFEPPVQCDVNAYLLGK